MIDNYDDDSIRKAMSVKRLKEIEILFPLVSKGVKRQCIIGGRYNELHYASSPEIVSFFISSGIDVNIKNPETDETPLLTVIKLNKSPDVVKELLNYGASIEARNKHTLNTPLNQAMLIPECSFETIQALLEKGAVVDTANNYCDTPLHNACRGFRGDLRVIELLLKCGSPVNFKNLYEDTPLNVSLKNPLCTVELVRKLLKFNATVTVKVFRDAVQNLHDDYLNIISELMQEAVITNADQWSDILRHLLGKVRNKEKLIDCGRLIIKHSFLQCDDPHTPFVHSLHRIKVSAIYLLPLIHSLHLTGNAPESVHKQKSYLASVTDDLKLFCDDCFSEIKHMKTNMLDNNITLYEFVISKAGKSRLDSKILKILKENKYPIYADIILNKIKRAAVLDKLVMHQVYTIVQQDNGIRRIVLDAFSVSNIAKYLSIDDIRNFVDAFCNPSKDEYYFWDNLVEIETQLGKAPQVRCSVTKKKKR